MTKRIIEQHHPAMTTSALLAGFSFTAALSLLLSGKLTIVSEVMVTAFIISTAAFIVSTMASVRLLQAAAAVDTITNTTIFDEFEAAGTVLGFTAFIVGLGVSGLLYAYWLGVVSIVCAISMFGAFFWLTARLAKIESNRTKG